MDIETIDSEYSQLETEAQRVADAVAALAAKLQAAAQSGDANAREWVLDLKSLALQIQQEQVQMQTLLQAMHGFAVNIMQSPPPPPVQQGYPQQGYAPGPGFMGGGPGFMGGGGGLQRFLGSGFGRAIEMGAGFGLGSDLINKIF